MKTERKKNCLYRIIVYYVILCVESLYIMFWVIVTMRLSRVTVPKLNAIIHRFVRRSLASIFFTEKFKLIFGKMYNKPVKSTGCHLTIRVLVESGDYETT